MNPCLLITIYEHGATIGDVVRRLAAYGLPLLIVDDGSGPATAQVLDKLALEYSWLSVERFSQNRGRGVALRHAYRTALARGFTHAVQLDADGQHDPADVARLLEAARQRPRALVLGDPIFDESAPALRMFGRQFSRGLVWFETLSLAIRDPLCGMRCMPLAATVDLIGRRPMGDRMDFEPEVAVRLLWDGLQIVNAPVRVRYFEGGLSHFRPLVDTLRIARAHARLIAGMLPRSPLLLARKLRRAR